MKNGRKRKIVIQITKAVCQTVQTLEDDEAPMVPKQRLHSDQLRLYHTIIFIKNIPVPKNM